MLEEARQEALKQIAEEDFDKTVQVLKEKIRSKRPWWHYIWPIKITVTWRFNDE